MFQFTKIRLINLTAFAALTVCISNAALGEDHSAEEMVAKMRKADMSYRQLMQVFGSSMQQISLGIYSENKQMVEAGANYILGHPAPNHKPWSIMPKDAQEDFKDALLSFDPLLDMNVKAILQATTKNDWITAGDALNELNSTCISCHSEWKKRVK